MALAAAELRAAVLPAEVIDAATLRDRDDLLLWLSPARQPARKVALHLVPGGVRGRITLTRRRFVKADFATGPLVDALRARLCGSTIADVAVLPGERVALVELRSRDGVPHRLVVELFGNRGLWAALDADRRIAVLSRLPQTRDRDLRPQALWQEPPRRAGALDPPVRFVPPILTAIDALFTASDERADLDALSVACAQALARARASCLHKVEGLRRQVAQTGEADALRARADLMLAYAHTVARGATSMRVPDPAQDGAVLDLPLAPDKPVVAQARALYERARRLADGLVMAQTRLTEAEALADTLEPLAQRLAAASSLADVQEVRDALIARRLLEDPAAASAARPRAPKSEETYRRFTSVEGHEILCGKSNEQNDRLTLRTARGNDVWLHIGRGYAGSHVIVRVPRGKSASLESLLDAAAIAVHFSKARGADKAEVIYTQAKHVRKARGSSPGAVVPHHTKTLYVRADEARLRRLLASSGPDP